MSESQEDILQDRLRIKAVNRLNNEYGESLSYLTSLKIVLSTIRKIQPALNGVKRELVLRHFTGELMLKLNKKYVKESKKKTDKKIDSVFITTTTYAKVKLTKSEKRKTDDFLKTFAWRKLRMQVIVERGNRCECCGASPTDGIIINVDHIKPRKLFPKLALDINNLQILCDACNHGKGNWDQTKWGT
jgi:hypothetical protein